MRLEGVADEPARAVATPKKQRRRRFVFVLAFLLLSTVGAGAAASLFGARAYRWRAFTLRLSVQPASRMIGSGQTRLAFAPLGEVRARTHAAPVTLRVGLDAIGFDEMRRLALKPPPRNALERDFRRAAGRAVRDFALRLIGLGALGALAAPLLLRARRARDWLLAPLAGALFIAGMLFWTQRTFRAEAFRSPTYTGSLQQAPWAIALARNAVSNSEALGSRLRNVATGLQALYGRISASSAPIPAGDADTLKVLHVSDIHNNALAVGFVRDLARQFQVEAVIDTGDLTDFGTPLENQAVRALGALGVPYVFVPGNHDSRATMDAVARFPGGVVLGGEIVSVAGLRILGAPDPAAERPGAGDVDTSEEALRAAGEMLLARYQGGSGDPPPDLVCVHNPRQAAALVGVAPLVLCGHLHRAYVQVERNTVVCNAGTTGAAGARYFEKPEGVAFSAAILHFSRADDEPRQRRPRLLFIDQVVLDGSLNQYSLTRRTFGSSTEGAVTTSAPAPPDTPR